MTMKNNLLFNGNFLARKTEIIPVTLLQSSWTTTSGNRVKYTITGLNFFSDSVLQIVPPSSANIVELDAFDAAEFFVNADVSVLGQLTVFAKNIPTINITVTLIIQ